jgi:hypothetical protein
MTPTPTRYEIELDMIERNPALDDAQAIALLGSEFALALNASHFMAVCAHEIAVSVRSRSVPQEGVARYAVSLEFAERTPELEDEQAAALLCREFQRAMNASYFWRMSTDDFSVRVTSRAPAVDTRLTLRAA